MPSAVGKLKPLITTVPVPLPDSSRLALEAFVCIKLSEIVMPSITADVLAVTVVKTPVDGVVAPIVVSSMLPPLMSALAINTVPEPEAVKTKSLFDCVVVISLSLICIWLSTNSFGTVTVPVPLGANTRSSLLLLAEMLLPLTVIAPEYSGELYNSVNMVFTCCMACLKVSPVPSLAFVPTFKLILAIILSLTFSLILLNGRLCYLLSQVT